MRSNSNSPRFLGKTWEQLPRELVDVMKIQANRGVGSFGGSDLPQGDKTPATVTAGTKFFDQNGKQHATKEEADAVGQKTGRNLRTERAARNAYNSDTRQTIGQRTNVNQSKDGAKPKGDYISEDDEDNSAQGQATIARIPDNVSNKYPFDSNDLESGALHNAKLRKSKISKAEWDAMKSSIEDGAFGNTGNSPTTGVSTKIPFDASPDYEGASHAKISPDTAFDYENVKPEAGKEPQAPKVDKDEQGIVKTQAFVYSDKPNNYKIPQDKYKGTSRYGIRYGVKFINKEDYS